MTELERACEKFVDKNGPGYIDENDLIRLGFLGALKPEHMKHTEEVRGLIEGLKSIESGSCISDPNVEYKELMLDLMVTAREVLETWNEALKPFESGGVK